MAVVLEGSLAGAFLDRLDAHVEFILIAGGLVGLAFLINRFAPQQRRRIRRLVILFGLYLLAVVVSSALHVAGFLRIWQVCHFVAELLEVFTAINLLAVALFDVARVLRLKPLARTLKIVLPAALPRIFVGFRLAAGIALTVAVTVEVSSNPLGLGYAMILAEQELHPDLMLAYLLWIGIIGWGLNFAIVSAQRRLFVRA